MLAGGVAAGQVGLVFLDSVAKVVGHADVELQGAARHGVDPEVELAAKRHVWRIAWWRGNADSSAALRNDQKVE